MTQLTEADRYLLEKIKGGSEEGWTQLVDRYQGRLFAFARAKRSSEADAEDLVQETFMAFLKALAEFRNEASIETYLFTILRHKIVDAYRGKAANIALLQDVVHPAVNGEASAAASETIPSAEPTGSWYARRDEAHDLQRQALTDALRQLVSNMKKALNFRDLQIVEMIFYCQLRNKDVARIAQVRENQVALIKHRCLRQIQEHIARQTPASALQFDEHADSLLSEIWNAQRLSCPKRSTIGAYLLDTLDQPWRDYVAFHLEQLGCQFCQANLQDLQNRGTQDPAHAYRDRILQSTIGFLSTPH